MNGMQYIDAPVKVFFAVLLALFAIEGLLLLGMLRRTLRRNGNPPPRWRRRCYSVIHAVSAVTAGCVLYAFFVEPYWLQITVVRLQSPKIHNTVLRIVQLSDLHCDPKPRLENRLPAIVNVLKPDVIVFTGDAVNSAAALPLFQKTLAAMHAPLGKFAVRGNWDYQYGDVFAETGFEELKLNAVRLEKDGQPFMLCGVNYHHGRISQRALNQLDKSTWNGFLYHAPDLIKYLDDEPVDLYLCGHTHGGQVVLPFVGPLSRVTHGKGFERGLYTVGSMAIYVHRGIGMGGFGPRVRFFARPEIVLFEIHPAAGTIDEHSGTETKQD